MTARPALTASGLPDAAGWWGEFGRPGWAADSWLGIDAPWTTAGLARGGFRVDEPGRPQRQVVDPGGQGSFSPLVWYDTLQVSAGDGGATEAFDGALVRAEGRTQRFGPRGAEGIVDLGSGDFAWDENALMVARRDSLQWLRAESYGLKRGPVGSYELTGRHLWGIGGGIRRGAHELEGSFSQEGDAPTLLGTEEQSTSSRSGSITYRYAAPELLGEVSFTRGIAHAESFSDFTDPSNRDANASQLDVRVTHASGLTAGVEARDARSSRTLSDESAAEQRFVWGDAGWSGDLAGGAAKLGLGGGVHSGLNRRVWLAPEASYSVHGVGYEARVGAERVVHAVWSDLAIGQDPFVQSTWAGVLDLRLGATEQRRVRLTFLGGRTRNRAIVTRLPVTEFQLRTGVLADPDPYAFGLVYGDAEWGWRALFGHASGFALTRPNNAVQPRVDPGFSGRALVGGRFRLFGGDLGVELDGWLEGVGARDSEEGFGRVLPAYATSTFAVALRLADATVAVRVRDLENEIHLEPWIDSDTGLEALGPGREVRFALTLALRN